MSNMEHNQTLEELIETMESRYSWLDTGNTLFVRLPDNLIVRGNLDLRGTGINSLPNNLTVHGSLYIDDTQITALPDNLIVDGEIYIYGTAKEE